MLGLPRDEIAANKLWNSENLNEVAKTQVLQVAYFLKKEFAEFEKAKTLEDLGESVFSRSTCLDMSHSEQNPTIIHLSQQAKLI